jgi:phospholipase/carboxylesterase
MDTPLLPTFEIDPEIAPRFTVIWLHGLGANGHDFEDIIPLLHLPPERGVRFVFPHAPEHPITINGGMVMPAWYDLRSLDFEKEVDEQQINASSLQIEALIQREIDSGIPPERILLAGFSQGGAIVYHTALRYPHTLAGIIALSTYLPTASQVIRERHSANFSTPMFISHGTLDEIVPYYLGEGAKDKLISLGYPVEWHHYPMQHQMCIEQVEQLSRFILRITQP